MWSVAFFFFDGGVGALGVDTANEQKSLKFSGVEGALGVEKILPTTKNNKLVISYFFSLHRLPKNITLVGGNATNKKRK